MHGTCVCFWILCDVGLPEKVVSGGFDDFDSSGLGLKEVTSCGRIGVCACWGLCTIGT